MRAQTTPFNSLTSIARYIKDTIDGQTPLMRKMQSYQGDAVQIPGALSSALSPIETAIDLLLHKNGGGLKGAIERGGDIPSALYSRGMDSDTANMLGMAIAMVVPGAGEMTQLSKATNLATGNVKQNTLVKKAQQAMEKGDINAAEVLFNKSKKVSQAGLYDTTLTGQKPNQELLNGVQRDMQLGKQTNFQFKPGDKIVSNGKNLIVKSSYIENGRPRYEVYTPGKKNSPAHQFRVYESDIIKPNEKINTSTSGAKSQQIGQTNSQTPTGENRGGVGQILVQNQTNPYTKENVKQLLNQNPQNPQLNNLYYGLRNFEGDVSNILNDSEKRLINKYVAQQPLGGQYIPRR